MALDQLNKVIQHLRTVLASEDAARMADADLLNLYVRQRDSAAFEALVRRHCSMVWGVCQRILRNVHDAEDAFQATFLVLIRRASAVRPPGMIGNWLYGVANRTARHASQLAVKRRVKEAAVRVRTETPEDPWAELRPLLDRELERLPQKYRAVVVLDLEGKTRSEVARDLGLAPGTVASRLARARALLAKRLACRGPVLSAAALATMLAQNVASASMPITVASNTIQAASLFAVGSVAARGVLSVKAIALAEGVLKTMLLSKLKSATVVLAALAILGVGAAVLTQQVLAEKSANQPVKENKQPIDQPVKENKEGEKEIVKVSGVWPQWRGPNRDGVVHGVTVPKKWPKTLKEEWKVPVGKGIASPVVVGAKVYVFTRQKNDDEVVRCLDLAGGEEKWRSKPCPAPYKVGAGEGTADDRPRSTPVVAGTRVFTLGMTGILSCLDARTGKLLWRKDTGYLPYMATSPLVADGLCIVHVAAEKKGGLTAFDARTGEVKWCYSEGPSPVSASPILVNLAGERQFVTYYHGNLLGVSAATGKKLWVAPCGPGANITPVQYKDLLIFAPGDKMEPLRAIRLEKGAKGITVKEVWKAIGHPSYYCSPVLAGDLLFGMAVSRQGHFFCLDAKTGKTLWEGPPRMGRKDRPEAHASILNAGSVLLFLTNRGRLLVIKPSAKAYEPIAEYLLSDTDTHAHPVFLGDRILIKDQTTLRLFRIGHDDGTK